MKRTKKREVAKPVGSRGIICERVKEVYNINN
jgi:hypothetical protein